MTEKVAAAVLTLGFFLLVGAAFRWVWNAVVPDVFAGVRELSFWQAGGLLLLLTLVGGFVRAPDRMKR